MGHQVVDLLDRPTYGFSQVDRLLGLPGGTARRWIDGYVRGGKAYPPVVRPEVTGEELVTWGEFVETRLLSEYRDAGVPIIRLRPAVSRLREELSVRYPLAYARPFLDVHGKELVRAVQDETQLDRALHLVVVRNDQLVLSDKTQRFIRSVDWGEDGEFVQRIRPLPDAPDVVIDPLRQFGEPVVRSVPTEVIVEQVRAGDSISMIAELFELTTEQVEEALRFELVRARRAA